MAQVSEILQLNALVDLIIFSFSVTCTLNAAVNLYTTQASIKRPCTCSCNNEDRRSIYSHHLWQRYDIFIQKTKNFTKDINFDVLYFNENMNWIFWEIIKRLSSRNRILWIKQNNTCNIMKVEKKWGGGGEWRMKIKTRLKKTPYVNTQLQYTLALEPGTGSPSHLFFQKCWIHNRSNA